MNYITDRYAVKLIAFYSYLSSKSVLINFTFVISILIYFQITTGIIVERTAASAAPMAKAFPNGLILFEFIKTFDQVEY